MQAPVVSRAMERTREINDCAIGDFQEMVDMQLPTGAGMSLAKLARPRLRNIAELNFAWLSHRCATGL